MELCPCLDKASELGNKFKNLRLNRNKFAKFRDPAYRKSRKPAPPVRVDKALLA